MLLLIEITYSYSLSFSTICDCVNEIENTDVGYLLGENGDFSVYRNIVKQYFSLNDEAQKRVDDFFRHELEGEKVLGILCRGTDYRNMPPEHPVQPDLESVMQKADEIFGRYRCTKIFLGTEDKEIYAAFQKKYGDLAVTNRKRFIPYAGKGLLAGAIQNTVQDLKEEGMEYLVTIALLARCDCFIGGNTSGTVGVMLMNDAFEYKFIFDLGLYP